ncbi:transposase, partial [Streptococcus thermophilus]|uniref:transposase n=1 Tax=Streptococcus thermophilus TaxID=1308 RepID=UPI003F4A8390
MTLLECLHKIIDSIKKLITILDNRRQTTIRNYFLKYPLKVRQQVQFITMDMSGAYIPLA